MKCTSEVFEFVNEKKNPKMLICSKQTCERPNRTTRRCKADLALDGGCKSAAISGIGIIGSIHYFILLIAINCILAYFLNERHNTLLYLSLSISCKLLCCTKPCHKILPKYHMIGIE